jgi:CheY-like chemotaxis protein
VTTLKNVLHIEDETDIRKITKVSLETLGGLTVEQCANGREAISQAALSHPDLLLIDVMMPGLSGPETLAELRKIPHMKDIPAIFMTAKIQPAEIETLEAFDVIGIITKPFDPVSLPADIAKLWNAAH